MRRLAAPQGRIVFVILRTACSPPVALHPASQRRSYLRLPESGIIPEEDFHLLNRACSQAHSFRRKPESSQIMLVYKSCQTSGYRIKSGMTVFVVIPADPGSRSRAGPGIQRNGGSPLHITHYPSPITHYCLFLPPPFNSLPRSRREDCKTSLSLYEGRG